MNNTARGSRRNNTQRRQSVPISGRRRSRSPDSLLAQPQGQPNVARKLDASVADQNRRKKPGNPSLPASSSRPFLVAVDDGNSDRGRKSKIKSRPHNRHLTENVPHPWEANVLHSKKDRSKSRESVKLPAKGAPSDAEGSGRDTHGVIDAFDYNGPLGAGEFAKLKRELDGWKKLAQENKKTMKRQSKAIEELKQRDASLKQKLKESDSQISKLQSKTKKLDEAVTTVESNSQCQICMELLYRPYALSPCGHILCVTCLQEWFRKAPASDDDMYEDRDPDYLLRRRKTCPCCRANVRHRPIPVFMIKAVVAAIAKAKGSQPGALSGRELTSNDSDPWEGLFPDEEEEIDDYGATDDDDEDDEDDDLDEEDEDESSWCDDVFSYGTGSGEDSYDGSYVQPQWEPPSVVVDEDEYLLDGLYERDLNCLRRGVSIGMLREYDVEYRHDEGLIARDENYRIYLGWNIRLSADDETGEMFMQYIVDDMNLRPDRWIVADDNDGIVAHRLVPEHDVYDFQDTDTDNYMDVDDMD